MEIDNVEILKKIKSFLGAENELAIKEAKHQIKIFELVFEKEIDLFQNNEKKELINPHEDPSNVEIIKVIDQFKIELRNEKERKKNSAQKNIELKKNILNEFKN